MVSFNTTQSELNRYYGNICEWIESNREYPNDADSEGLIIGFFQYVFENIENLIPTDSDKFNKNRLMILITDLLFYALLSDSQPKIKAMSREIALKENSGEYYDKIYQKLIAKIQNNEERQFIKLGFNLFCIATSIYYDHKAAESLKNSLNSVQNIKNPKLKEVIDLVVDYLIIYSISRSHEIDHTLLLRFNDFKNSTNPYHLAGYLNLTIKFVQAHPDKSFMLEDAKFGRLLNIINQAKFTKFNEGYYYLVLARYSKLVRKYEQALNYAEQALNSTNKYCYRNGQRKADIINLREQILTEQRINTDIERLDKLKKRVDETRRDMFGLIAILVNVIVIPISIFVAFFQINSQQRDVTVVLTLVKYVVASTFGVSLLVILIPYIFRGLDYLSQIAENFIYHKR
ncbi:MAG: hypothetical protein V1702_01910 [Candidatus Woesearchaeota archaeon]